MERGAGATRTRSIVGSVKGRQLSAARTTVTRGGDSGRVVPDGRPRTHRRRQRVRRMSPIQSIHRSSTRIPTDSTRFHDIHAQYSFDCGGYLKMRRFKIGLALASAAMLAACSGREQGVPRGAGPVAYVRFVNAIPDSGGQDWRFVDAVEGFADRPSTCPSGEFSRARATRARPRASGHLRIFQSSIDPTFADPTKTSPAIVSTVFVDSTFTLVGGHTLHDHGRRQPAGAANGEARDPHGRLR